MTFEEIISIDSIFDLRNKYLESLIEAQELFLELKITSSKVFIIKSGNVQIGYFFLDNDNILWEYFILHEYINQVDKIFGEIIIKFSVTKALCKSFDHVLLSCCLSYHKTVKVFGIHFRKYLKNWILPDCKDITIRFPAMEDKEVIKEINEDIFESEEEINYYIENKKMFLFEKGTEMAGFGVFSRVINGRPEFDIGMCVNKKFRRQGLGTYILKYLVGYCEKNGWRPIGGCAIENTASRRCLENAGFTADYRLLEFTFETK
jgi:GNAT superfamily N-acetyltransferase